MSNALSDYLESGLLHHIFRSQSFPKPTEVAIALCSGSPLDSNTGSTIPELPQSVNGRWRAALWATSRFGIGAPEKIPMWARA